MGQSKLISVVQDCKAEVYPRATNDFAGLPNVFRRRVSGSLLYEKQFKENPDIETTQSFCGIPRINLSSENICHTLHIFLLAVW